jgi:APA family basic amino acid/polyamine antiporter
MGTLFAFVLVCVGVMVLRRSDPGMTRPFRAPWVPFIPILGALVCMAMMIKLDSTTQRYFGFWMIIGLVIYFSYSRAHSRLNSNAKTPG